MLKLLYAEKEIETSLKNITLKSPDKQAHKSQL